MFNSLFGNPDDKNASLKWNHLTKISQLDDIITESFNQPVAIFKHSTRCAISRMSLRQFEKQFNLQHEINPYFLDLLLHRDISDEIVQRFNVTHQSPQLLLIKDGKSIYNASHESIDAARLSAAIR